MNQITESIKPISSHEESIVRSATRDYISIASEIFTQALQPIPVMFNLKGRAAGMYRVINNQRVIRYNPYIFSKYFDDNLQTTVPHEVAHYVVDMLYGVNRVKPHGPEWREVMLLFKAEPKATGNYDLTGIPVRRQKKHDYKCDCKTHRISTIRHNKIMTGTAVYLCRSCKTPITSLDNE
jgi:SprT protein